MRTATFLVGVLMAVGCGSDGYDSSLPGSKPVNQLTAPEATKLCEEVIAYTKGVYTDARLIEDSCRVAGLTAARDLPGEATSRELEQKCQAEYAACKLDPPGPPGYYDCADARPVLAPCSATVDQYAACVNEQLAEVVPSCAGLTRATIDRLSRDEDGPACEIYYASCATP